MAAELEKKGSADYYLSKKRLISRLKSFKNAVKESAVELNLKKEEIKAQTEIAEGYSQENERLKQEVSNKKIMEDKIKQKILIMEKEHKIVLMKSEEMMKEKEAIKDENVILKKKVDHTQSMVDIMKGENKALKESVGVLCNVAFDVEQHLKKKNVSLKELVEVKVQEVDLLRKENAALKEVENNYLHQELLNFKLIKELKEELKALKNTKKVSVAIQTKMKPKRRSFFRRIMKRN